MISRERADLTDGEQKMKTRRDAADGFSIILTGVRAKRTIIDDPVKERPRDEAVGVRGRDFR
jgi:hypothetical protein